MKRILFILSIVTLFVSACGQATKKQAETVVVTETTNNEVVLNEQEENSDFVLLDKILEQLNISANEYDYELMAQKQLPYMKSHSVFIIPKIVDKDEYDGKTFDAYILIVENETGKITNKFYEKESWISDAVRLENIEIDTAPYRLNDDTRAFGVRVKYTGSSRANPYASEQISLFIPHEDALVRVLKNYEIAGFRGEWDTNCEGEFTDKKEIFVIGEDKTNGFNNIIVKYTYTTQTNTKVDDNCIEKEEVEQGKKMLRYTDGEYLLQSTRYQQ